MQTIHLDVSNKGVVPAIYAKQGDVGRKFRAVITDNGEAYDIPVDALLSVWYSGTSGEGNYSMIGENSAFSIDGNAVIVELITQMLTNHGGGNVCLVMNRQDGTQIGTWNIPYIVEQLPGMGSPAAEQYFTALTEAAAKASESAAKAAEAAATFETDTSLSVAGKAADAATTGEALAGKAPVALGAPHNYLDNSDFRNPVNQRGATEASQSILVDRWWVFGGKAYLTAGGITGDAGAFITQRLPIGTRKDGKTYTLVAYYSDGTVYVDTDGVFVTNTDVGVDLTKGIYPNGKTITHVALYEGEYTAETLPEYKPKGYSVELGECLRYYQKDVRVNAVLITSSYFAVSYMHRMRITPTVTFNRADIYGVDDVQNFDGCDCGINATQIQWAYLPTVTASAPWGMSTKIGVALTVDLSADL